MENRDVAAQDLYSSTVEGTVKKTIYLVQCARQQDLSAEPMEAKKRYISTFFKKARQYVKNRREVCAELGLEAEWYILSTKHHLIPPSEPIAWYDVSFKDICHEKWTRQVIRDMRGEGLKADRFVFLASKKFLGCSEKIRERLESEWKAEVCTPLRGKTIGRQLGWLRLQNEHWNPGHWNPGGWQDEYAWGEEVPPILGP